MRELTFFDCSVGIDGPANVTEVLSTPDDFARLHALYNIERALIYDRGAVESGDVGGFDRVVAFCADQPSLLPLIPLVPPACGEQPEPEALVQWMLDTGVAAAGVWPRLHNFDLEVDALGALLDVLQAHRLPVIYHSMGHGDHPWRHEPDWRGVAALAAAFPDLPLIVTPTGMLQGRRALPLLAARRNVMLDLSCQTYGFVEHVVARFGPERLVCTARLPFDDPGVMTTQVLYADVDDDARRAIAGGNLARLIEAAR